MHRDLRPLSATQISRKMRKASSNLVSHHVDVMWKKGILSFVRSEQVRGGIEKFFISEVAEHVRVGQILEDTEEDDISYRRSAR
jgi:hypothetical protein